MRTMEVLLGTTVAMDQYSEVAVIFTFHQIAIQTHLLVQASHAHTPTRQGKGTAFSQAAQTATISKFMRLKCSELMFKQQQKITSN